MIPQASHHHTCEKVEVVREASLREVVYWLNFEILVSLGKMDGEGKVKAGELLGACGWRPEGVPMGRSAGLGSGITAQLRVCLGGSVESIGREQTKGAGVRLHNQRKVRPEGHPRDGAGPLGEVR